MKVPAPFAKQQGSRTVCIEHQAAEFGVDNGSPDHRARLSAKKTTVALLALCDCPVADWAATALWDENRDAIEREMARSLHSSPDASLRERVLSGLVSQARFFCLEVDEPKAWIARCANLESRRVALTLKK